MFYYSYLNASTGFSFAACNAGRIPDKVPIKKEKDNAPRIKYQGKQPLINLIIE